MGEDSIQLIVQPIRKPSEQAASATQNDVAQEDLTEVRIARVDRSAY
jgi:hypothetical protein